MVAHERQGCGLRPARPFRPGKALANLLLLGVFPPYSRGLVSPPSRPIFRGYDGECRPLAATVTSIGEGEVPSLSSSLPSRQLIDSANSLYRDLDEANLSRKYSETIKFSFVSPPSETHSNSWKCESQREQRRHAMDDAGVFEEIASTHKWTKPLALYLPGLDGVGISATTQFDDLAQNFELWRMSISTSDRTTFAGLTETVSSFIRDVAVNLNRDIIIVGESFGGLLAPAVAMRVKAQHFRREGGSENDDTFVDPIKGMVLVNPATSFDETQWSNFVPFLAELQYLRQEDSEEIGGRFKLPSAYSLAGGLALAATVPDNTQFGNMLNIIGESPRVESVRDLVDFLESIIDGFGILDSNLPADVIEFRVGQWLPVGCSVVNPRIGSLDVSTLIIAGQDDKMVPSKKESARLVDVMPNARKLEVRGSGHFVLDNRFNLTKAIIESGIDPFDRKSEPPYDAILDWSLPSDTEVKEIIDRNVRPLRRLVSPVFFSTSADGKRCLGLSKLPAEGEGPLLFVSNHQFGGLDLGLIISQLIEDRGIKARGLAHPVIFAAGSGQNGISPEGVDSNRDGLFQQFGAVKVTPRNYYRLMQTGQSALLFPGGVREVFHGKKEAYQLFWPEKLDFVRTAARFNATIVPLSAVGAADSVNILIDAPDMLKLPFGLGERAANSSATVVSARFDREDSAELFQPPFALPKPLPARHYFIFGKPINTRDISPKDKDACEQLYKNIQSDMKLGFADVLRAREKDPFSNSVARVAYEQLNGKQAPTFPISELIS